MMARVYRYATQIAPNNGAGFFEPLLMTVVAMLAQRLMITLVPEFFLIASMRLNVIDDGGSYDLPMLQVIGTQWMLAQIPRTILLPCGSIATFRG